MWRLPAAARWGLGSGGPMAGVCQPVGRAGSWGLWLQGQGVGSGVSLLRAGPDPECWLRALAVLGYC